jgi:nucleoside-diphosphate-sugar epimerase
VPGPLDVPHTWTSIADAARTLVTVAADQRGWGRAWLVPSNPPLTVRELATRFAAVAGAPPPKLTRLPSPVLWLAGVFSPLVRELRTTHYQFARPFVLDAATTTAELGLSPTPLDDALRTTADRLRAPAATTPR